jgi:hypothetical protein
MGRPPKFPQLHDETWLRKRSGKPIEAIAKELGCVPGSVTRAFDRYGIVPVSPPTENEISVAPIQSDGPLKDVLDPLEGLYYLADTLRNVSRQLDQVQETLRDVDRHISHLNADALKGDIETIRETLRKGFA